MVLAGTLSTLLMLWSSSPGQPKASSGWTRASFSHSLMTLQLAIPSLMGGISEVSIQVCSYLKENAKVIDSNGPILFKSAIPPFLIGALLTHSHQLAGRWTRGHSAGGSRNSSSYGSNPKFWLRVCDKGEVVVSLLQQERRRNSETFSQRCLENNKNTKHQHHQAIALHMWKVWDVACWRKTS